jgi:hypothetical protein
VAKEPKVIYEGWFDVDGKPVDNPVDAAYLERKTSDGIRLYAEDATLIPPGRYKTVPGSGMSYNVAGYDGLNDNSNDWIKTRTWDVHTRDNSRLVTTLDEWLAVLDMDPAWDNEKRFSRVAHMVSLPSWRAAPDQLKEEVYAWLEEMRDK